MRYQISRATGLAGIFCSVAKSTPLDAIEGVADVGSNGWGAQSTRGQDNHTSPKRKQRMRHVMRGGGEPPSLALRARIAGSMGKIVATAVSL
jgi:hypothetical protein